jgi:regulatory protein
VTQTRVAALRMLMRRDYTAFELRKKLIDKEHTPEDITAALDSLAADRLLDDRRVAISFVRVSSSLKGRGRLRIARELEVRGVAKDLIREALEALPAEDETESIRRFLARKRLPARLPAADHRRIFGQLIRRGFSADIIARVIREPRDDD